MLNENRWASRLKRSITVASHVERRQGIPIIRLDLHWLPSEAILIHDISKALIVLVLCADGEGGCYAEQANVEPKFHF